MIEYQRQGAVVRLSLRRAEKKNALNEAMWRELERCCSTLRAELEAGASGDAPRVLVLAGEPGAFCAGADIAELSALVHDANAMARNNALVSQAQLALERLPLPTIAVIDGPCFGGGLGLAAACDFRIASARARFAITPAKLGLLYSIEDTRRVVRLLGFARTRQMLMRGLQLDAATALTWGVLDELVEPDALPARLEQWLAELAAQSPTSMRGIKSTLGWLGGNVDHSEASVRQAFDAAFGGADFAEGAAAFLARRTPVF